MTAAADDRVQQWFRSTSPLPLAEVAAWVRSTSSDSLMLLGTEFLLQRGALDSERGSAMTTTVSSLDVRASDTMQEWAKASVYLVRHTGRSAFPNFISIGRTTNNDIVIADSSISRFHAYFVRDRNGLGLIDGGSHNGTFLDGRRVSTRGSGSPAIAQNKSLVRLGNIELVFVDREGLKESFARVS